MTQLKHKLRAGKGEQGAALLTVLVAVMILTILLLEFQYAAMVERKLAYNDLNQTQAYYLAKSAVRVGLLRVALFARLKNNPQLRSLAPAPGMLDPFLDQVWQMPMPPFPPDRQTMDKMFKADKDAAQNVLEQTKIEEGQYSTVIKAESSKINLNSLMVPRANLGDRPNFTIPPTRPDMQTGLLLVNLMERFIQESDDPYEEFPDLRPEEQVTDIMDWVNPGDTRFMGGNKDSHYQQQDPPYRAKRNRFFTIEELRLVKGIDGPLFEKLRPHVTVYSYDSKININTASETMYRALFRDFTDDDLRRIIEQRDLQGGWASEQQFVDFVVQVLNRTGFSVLYPNANSYPFTVGTQSFLIEGLGIIRKSASSIQRTIQVAVAFSAGRGGMVVQVATDVECRKVPGRFWNATLSQCITDPTNQSECTNVGGTWMQQGGQEGCKINQAAPNPPIFRPVRSLAPGGPGAGARGGAGRGSGGNSLKILHWYET